MCNSLNRIYSSNIIIYFKSFAAELKLYGKLGNSARKLVLKLIFIWAMCKRYAIISIYKELFICSN